MRNTAGFAAGEGDCALLRATRSANISARHARKKTDWKNAAEVRMSDGAAIFVAVVAGGGAVGITVHAVVNIVGLRLLVRRLRMAVDARKVAEVRGDLVAVVANRTVVRNREEGSVIEGSAQPAGGVVAT